MSADDIQNPPSVSVDRRIIAAIWAVTGVVAVWAIAVYNRNFDLLEDLTAEDGLFEYAQAVFFLVAGLAFLVGWARSRFRNLFALGLGLMLLVVAGEEISWGQRLFGVETPDSLASANVQGETNIHNLDHIHQSVRAVALVFILFVIVALPLLAHSTSSVRTRVARWGIPVAPLWTIPVTAVAVLFMVIPRLGDEVVFALDEVAETFLAATFFLYGATWLWTLNQRRSRIGGLYQNRSAERRTAVVASSSVPSGPEAPSPSAIDPVAST
jgi:hypothetical protein